MKVEPPALFLAVMGLLTLGCAGGKTAASPAAAGSAVSPAEAFFARYVQLSSSFDPAFASLYADDAIVHTSRKLADGSTKKLELQGAQWKQAIAQGMGLAKQRGDVPEFTEVRYRRVDGGFEVRTHRRSALKCYVDDQHRIVLAPDAQGALKIVEEHMLTQSLSSCPDKDPLPLMQQQVAALASRLPLQLDDETRLDSLRVDGKSLVYTFTLVSVAAGELDQERFRKAMQGTVVARSCLNPPLRTILDNGAEIAFDFLTKIGEPLLKLTVAERDCP